MSAIPFEILTLIFKLLKSHDLAQCQLVCRSWNQASLKILYSDIKLDTEEGCKLYVRTIKNTPQLGKYLETIKAGRICYSVEKESEEDYDEEDEEVIEFNNWDRHNLLDTVINYCPNVLEIWNSATSSTFLTKITNASSQGRLSRLQYMTGPARDDFYYYAKAALAFKKTLNTLELPENVPRDLFGAEIYPIFCQTLNQFPCLQTLEIICCHYSRRQLSFYDTIIDYCEDLTKLIIHPSSSYKIRLTEAKSLEIFQPHNKIETLECAWHVVNAEEQITYIMQKFPNLRSLTIYRDLNDSDNVVKFSVNTLIKFLRYIISLKKRAVSIILNSEDCVYPWVSVINEKINTADMSISIYNSSSCSFAKTVSTYFTEKSLILSFSSFTDYHIKLLSEIGTKVRSLNLGIHVPPQENVENVDHIIELIKLCPSLQHLELMNLKKLFYSDSIDYQNFELKSLSLRTYDHTIGSLEKISFIFPNLKKLHLFIPPQYSLSETITIDMPYTSFDILRCSAIDDFLFEMDVTEFYIRLKTDAGIQFYSATISKLQKINEDQRKRLDLDIICRSLTKLKIDLCDFSGDSI